MSLEIGMKYKVAYGDLNSCNTLVKRSSVFTLIISVDRNEYVCKTYGFRLVFIEFGRGGFYEKTSKNENLI